MADYKIQCTVIDVKNESGICNGRAKCKKNETYVISARTPEPAGMCGRSFASIYPTVYAMRWTEKIEWEKTDYIDLVCPDGLVTYRLTRLK